MTRPNRGIAGVPYLGAPATTNLEPAIPRPTRTDTAAVVRFAAGGFVALIALSIGAVFVLRGSARREAIRDARETTRLIAAAAVVPALDRDALRSTPTGVAKLDAVAARLRARRLVRLKLWDRDGRIIYSDDHRLIGLRFPLDDDKLTVIRRGGTAAGVSDLTESENRFEKRGAELVEVYTRVSTDRGTPLLLESYYSDAHVSDSAARITRAFLPAVLGALIVFALLQLPLGLDLAARIRSRRQEREQLLQQAITAGDQERRRIATDLHDGAVQDLAGVSFAIAAAADALRDGTTPTTVATTLDHAATTSRRGIQQLRTLLVEIYPPNLSETGLPTALRDLMAPLANAGMDTAVECDDIDLGEHLDALVYRIAHEGARNILRHSAATEVALSLERHDDSVRMTLSDNGRGFDPDATPQDGHFGLRAMNDLAASAGAELTVDARPGGGTRLVLDLGGVP